MNTKPFVLGALAVAAVFTTSPASAQLANLTGAWRCVENCRAGPGAPAFITQNGPNLNLVDDAGRPSRAWPDAFAPNNRIWADNWNTSAVFSPDGSTLQFDNGTIWQRDMGPPVRVRARPAAVVVR
ncbi:MAG TPA: hypothetical protein VGD96_22800 [Bradyrhizobium sp.]